MNRLETIQHELKINEQTSKEIKAKIKPLKQRLSEAIELGEDKEKIDSLKEELGQLDKQYNKLRSDFYFLAAEEKEEIRRAK